MFCIIYYYHYSFGSESCMTWFIDRGHFETLLIKTVIYWLSSLQVVAIIVWRLIFFLIITVEHDENEE